MSPSGEILVPGVKELIAPVTGDEQKKFEAIHFEMQDIHDSVGANVSLSDDVVKTLMGRMSKSLALEIRTWLTKQGTPLCRCTVSRVPSVSLASGGLCTAS